MIGLHEHDGYAPHSHEVRADHAGVARLRALATSVGHEVDHYTWGYNLDGNAHWSVVQVHADGFQAAVLEGEGLTETRAKAIAMILNAPEPS